MKGKGRRTDHTSTGALSRISRTTSSFWVPEYLALVSSARRATRLERRMLPRRVGELDKILPYLAIEPCCKHRLLNRHDVPHVEHGLHIL